MTAQRDITPTLAPLLQLLELEQPRVVSTTDIADYAAQVGLQWPTPLIVRRLRERGWLLDLTTQGVWEFAPASRAGAFGAGDPFVELRATLKRDPAAPYAVAAESAAYQLGLSSRRPERDVIGAPPGARLPRALEAFRLVKWSPSVPLVPWDGLPIWSVETLIGFMASKPSGYQDWQNVGEWITQAVRTLSADALVSELAGLPRSAWARAAYLLEEGGRPDLAADFIESAPAGSGPYYLGARESPGKYSATYGVVDSTGMGDGEWSPRGIWSATTRGGRADVARRSSTSLKTNLLFHLAQSGIFELGIALKGGTAVRKFRVGNAPASRRTSTLRRRRRERRAAARGR